ncbi:hypothetical protein [Tenacibaculum sp. nBUS_03]|uniref:hypothetical protein n=1 Tax=Tenacibaculum sp. nBUS_03 TaxID=3395320 RepID=UPI003EBA6D49
MKENHSNERSFSVKKFLLASIPSYFFPAVMSWTPGWIMNDKELMSSSYSTIATPSLIATVLVYLILWKVESDNNSLKNRYTRIFFMLLVTISIACLFILLFNFHEFKFNIIVSTILGTVITAWNHPVKSKELV